MNVVQQNFNVSAPNEVWVSDVTCFKRDGAWCYICVIIDLFSRKVIAHHISQRHSTQLISSTFRKAFTLRNPPTGPVYHSDRGVQYASYSFKKLLASHHIVQSFSKPGNPYDNAVAEAFFATLKKEELYRTNYRSYNELCQRVADYIAFYNGKRPHESLNYKTPDQVEASYTHPNEKV